MSLLETSVGTLITIIGGGVIAFLTKEYGPALIHWLLRRPDSQAKELLRNYDESITEYLNSIQRRDDAIHYLDRRAQRFERRYNKARDLIDKLHDLNEHEETQLQKILQEKGIKDPRIIDEIRLIDQAINDLDSIKDNE